MARPKKKVTEENIERFQRELEQAGDDWNTLLKDKRGRSRSCLLCRRRKQRCDHKLPTCTACLKAAVKCVQPARYVTSDNEEHTSSGSEIASPHTAIPPPLLYKGDGTAKASSVTTPSEPKSKKRKQNSQTGRESSTASTSSSSGKDEYTRILEKKLKYLEKMVDLPPTGTAYKKKLEQYKKIAHLLGEVGDLEKITVPSSNHTFTNATTTTNNNGNKLPPPSVLSHHTNPGDFFPYSKLTTLKNGSFSFIPASSSASSSNSSTTFRKSIDETDLIKNKQSVASFSSYIPALSSDSVDSIDFSKSIFAKYNLKELLSYDPAFEFDEQLSRSFLDIFFTRLQFKYPLLDEKEIYAFHDHYIQNNIYSFPEIEFHFLCGRMWLIFAISACLNMTTGKYKGLPPIRYFSTAVRHISRCGDNLNYVQRVELLTLLVLYILRTDRDSLVLYEIIKDVTDISKNVLHLNKYNPNDPFANKKLRLFWGIYLLERMICVAVGKPYTILEDEVDLPLFSEDSFNTKGQKNGVHFINQSLRLRRIESQFVEQLNILPQKNNTKEFLRKKLPLVKKFFHDLELWRQNYSRIDVKNFENETLKLYYYRSVRLLIQPYLKILSPEDRLFRECQAAAGQICQLYKIFHQKTVNGHSTPAVHTVFVAGVTLIYCMWLARNRDDQRRRKLGDFSKHTRPLVSASLFSTMDDLRACSVCLYVMAERSNFARTFRDTFDQLMNATVGNLIERCGPDSSELINVATMKTKSPKTGVKSGMPPAISRRFGTRQSKEALGFVEGAHAGGDPAEEKEYKRKQSALEKFTIPKSLSHLLIKENAAKVYEDGEEYEEEEGGHDHDDDDIVGKTGTVKVTSGEGSEEENQEYIVKKPANYAEFDWESFQQQAMWQQHSAQQNLQMYLSLLNGSNTEAMLKTPPVAYNNNTQQINSNNNNSANSSSSNNNNIRFPNPSSTPVMNGAASNNGILFSSGAHDMINNISIWTNDSVLNVKKPTGESSDSVWDHNSNYGSTTTQLPPTASSASPSPALWSMNKPVTWNVQATASSSNSNSNSNNNNNFAAGPAAAAPVEEFWTVNDDYGFLA